MPREEMLTEAKLATTAREARLAAGLTQAQAADLLKVRQSAISAAENDSTGRYSKLQCRMIALAGWQCEGPLWRVRRS